MPSPKTPAPTGIALVVVHPFGDHQKGDHITDPALIAEILDSEHAASVVKVAE